MHTLPEKPFFSIDEPLTAGTMHYRRLLLGSDWIDLSLAPLAILATVSALVAALGLLLIFPL